MSRTLWVLLTLVTYNVVLVAIGVWASRRTHDTSDFYLGGRRLGAWVAAISASASSSSAWSLLGVSGAAFLWGLPAIWLFPATVLGFILNWTWVAPRLMDLSRREHAVTLTEVIAGDPHHPLHRAIIRTSSVIILFSFIFYIASQFQAAGNAFANTFHLPMAASILVGAAVVLVYTLLGGFWAVSVTDTVQGLLMAAAAIFLPIVALVAVGGPGELWARLDALSGETTISWFGPRAGLTALAFVLGTLGIGLGYPGQPHVVNRFMALRDREALLRGRAIAIGWAVVIYAGTLTIGWCGRVLVENLGNGEVVFFEVANRLLPPVVAGVMVAAVLSAIMSTADSQLLVAASSVSHDLGLARNRRPDPGQGLGRSRLVVVGISLLAVAIALYIPDRIFSRVLFAWHAVGSAFGPLLLIRLTGSRVRSGAILATIVSGFALTVALHFLPDAPGDAAERLVPFFLALSIAMLGIESRSGRGSRG